MLKVYAGSAMMGNLGATACMVFLGTNIVRRVLRTHGMVIPREQPRYLGEVAVLRALWTLHDWLRTTAQNQGELYSMTIKAG